MDSLYGINGLVFWTAEEIRLRRQFQDHFADTMSNILIDTNSAWRIIQTESPLLTPRPLINQNYTNDDIWVQQADEEAPLDISDMHGISPTGGPIYYLDKNDHPVFFRGDGDLVLRPETTPGSYTYAKYLLESHSGVKPPFCVWQAGKSFRREQEQVTKNMRLKEFYQQEFQCFYADDTANDYHSAVLEPVRKMIGQMVALPTRIVESDRLPSYSQITMDIEVDNGDKWMEVCSISRRTDFPIKAKFQTKKGLVEKNLLVLEVAIGLDRCVYNFLQRSV